MSDSTEVLVEMFGHYKNEETRMTTEDGETIPLKEIARAMFQKAGVGLETIDVIHTGMDAEVTEALEELAEESEFDVEVEVFYPNVKDWIANSDDLTEDDYGKAWGEAFSWRNRCLMLESKEKYDDADFTIVGMDSSRSGEGLTRDARKYGNVVIQAPLKEYVDWDAVFDDEEEESGSKSEAASADAATAD
ncbi:hypothetical protein [Halorussus sp. AFM4]|uniref:hypothetical protein n=1 Tax=Halorussus sp. AFM4 TaxID=3421651 RepID=UPI003EBC7231